MGDDEAKRYELSLVSGESAILVRGPATRLAEAVGLLRGDADIPPSVFFLHGAIAAAQLPSKAPATPLSLAQVRNRAARLASEHGTEASSVEASELIPRLAAADARIREACVDLGEAAGLGQGTPAVAEWILDNEFIVDSNTRDFRVNLPRAFSRRLPVLARGRSAGLPRIYDLARELIADFELRIDKEGILAFLDAYQASSPLTIGELWALPQLLRLALIEGISELALRAAVELRERELADFWANRLICASRRGPDRLFAILARLALELPEPSPYFATQLASHLYDEDSVLVLVQSWLDRRNLRSLEDLSLRERTRQAKDQVSAANAFTSLRDLDLLDWKIVFERECRTESLLRGEAAGIYPSMDFPTRDGYRRAVEELARESGLSEE
jgi:cyclic beta-1,2-glucan synthetase